MPQGPKSYHGQNNSSSDGSAGCYHEGPGQAPLESSQVLLIFISGFKFVSWISQLITKFLQLVVIQVQLTHVLIVEH